MPYFICLGCAVGQNVACGVGRRGTAACVCACAPRQFTPRISFLRARLGSTGIITCWCVATFRASGFRFRQAEEVWELLQSAACAADYCVGGSLHWCRERSARRAVNTGCEARMSIRTGGELVEVIVDWLEPLSIHLRCLVPLGPHPVGTGYPRQIEEGGFEIVIGAISCGKAF